MSSLIIQKVDIAVALRFIVARHRLAVLLCSSQPCSQRDDDVSLYFTSS
jgi:hypothetical protein